MTTNTVPSQAASSTGACAIEIPQGVVLPEERGPLTQTLVIGDRFCVEIRGTVRESFTEFHVTGSVIAAMAVAPAAEELLGLVADTLAKHGIQTLQEKLFGLPEARPEVLKQREAHYRRQELDLHVPFTWISGVPLYGCDFVGIQVWGILPHNEKVRVKTVENAFTGKGRELTGPDFRLLYLPLVRGTKADGTLAGDAVAQTDQMFTNAEQALEAHGLSYKKVARTWIYYARLLTWYNDLNRIRTGHYRKVGFGSAGGPAFPASTGIQGRYGDEECLMDVLAFDSKNEANASAVPVVHSPRQDQSFNYGSAFSRGMTFKLEGRRTVSISGTASINSAGATIHLGNAELQCFETLMCIAAILEQQGGSLDNITSATLYCKDRDVWAAWNRVTRMLGVTAFPKICVIADVCRDDLLVEMEAVATF